MSTGSVSAAGSRLNLSQPSVSRLLSELEAKFGCRLFVRHARGMAPTPEAKAFLVEVERKLMVMTSLEDLASQIANKDQGGLVVGTNAGFSVSIVPQAVKFLNVLDKPISVDILVKSSQRVIDYVRSGLVELGLVHATDVPLGVEVLKKGEVPYVAILPEHHALTKSNDKLNLEALKNERLSGPDGAVSEVIKARRIGRYPEHQIVSGVSLAALEVAVCTGAVPIVDAFIARNWITKNGGVAHVLNDLPGFNYALLAPTETQKSQIAQKLLESLVQTLDQTASWATEL